MYSSSTLTLVHPGLSVPVGVRILEPTQRVTRAELDKRDARYRAYRERAYARAWAEDATLVGSVRSYGENGSVRRYAGGGRGGRRRGGMGGRMGGLGRSALGQVIRRLLS